MADLATPPVYELAPIHEIQVPIMLSHIVQAAFEAHLSPLASRIAVLVADLAGTERALGFIAACVRTDEARGIALLDVGTVLR